FLSSNSKGARSRNGRRRHWLLNRLLQLLDPFLDVLSGLDRAIFAIRNKFVPVSGQQGVLQRFPEILHFLAAFGNAQRSFESLIRVVLAAVQIEDVLVRVAREN